MERCKGATQFADLKNVANFVFTSITIDCKRRLRNSQERSLPSHTINKKVHYSSSSLAFGIRMLDIIVLTCRPKISQVLFLFHKLRRSKLLLLLRTNAISISPNESFLFAATFICGRRPERNGRVRIRQCRYRSDAANLRSPLWRSGQVTTVSRERSGCHLQKHMVHHGTVIF